MKHLFKILIIGLFVCMGISQTNAIQLNNASSKQVSCPGANVNDIIYISDEKETFYIYDEYRSSNRRAISNYESKVSIWQSDTSLLSGCTTADSWKMASNISPGNNQWVIAYGANCTFNKPTDKNKRTLQMVYNVGNYNIGTSGGIDLGNFQFTYYKNTTEVANRTPNYITVKNAHLTNFNLHSNECYNVELRYCGDGLITNGETCDPAHPSYNETTCSTKTCTPINTPTPKITVDKTDANPADLDANEDDSQTVYKGDKAVFKITVTNSGEEDLRNVVLTDAIAPSCNRTVAQTNALISQIGNKDTIFNVGEVFTYNCEKENSQLNYVNTIAVSGIGVISGKTVDDSDPTNILVLPKPGNYDLALRKTLSSTTPGPFKIGDRVTFDVRVINQGDVAANNIEVTDYIPAGLTLADTAWTKSGNKATRTVSNIAVGQSKVITISFTIDASALGKTVINYAEISKDDGDDCDSTPDSDNTNDGTPVNDEVGTGCNPGGDEDDHDPESIVVPQPTPAIDVIKSDANPLDQDGSTGNDTQTVNKGEQAVFKIRVINTGTEDLKEIVLTDVTEPNCAGSVTLPGTKPTTWSNFVVGGSGNNADALLQPGEYFEYTCIKVNTQANYTNTVGVTAKGKDSNQTVNADDPTQVVVTTPGVYDLALIKTLSTTTPGPFAIGDTVRFNIEVFNQGTIPANNIEITDYIPTGLTLNSGGWTQSGSIAKFIINTPNPIEPGNFASVSISFTINAQATNGSLTNYAEISADDGDDCDSTPDADNTNDGTPINDDIGNGCNPGGDEDDHDPETIVLGSVYDLALVKKLSSTTPGPFNIGSTVTFNVIVTNQGTINANNIEVTDYIPTGLTLNDANWTLSGSTAVRTILSITAGNSVNLPITFTINSQATGTVTNIAEISKDDGDDCDSTPDTDGTNDGTPVNDDIGNGCNPGGDEDDHDPETIVIGGTIPACINLTATPTTGVNSVTSTVVCTGQNVTSFKIDCGNGATFTGAGINNGTETFTKTCSYNAVGTYTPTCYINDTLTNTSCQKTVTVTGTSTSSSGSSGGGDVLRCNDIIQSGSSVTCIGNGQAKSAMLLCGTGDTQTQLFKNMTKNGATGRMEATFTCGEEVAECKVHDKANSTVDNGTLAWVPSPQCKTDLNPFCGDGIVNGSEQCDTGSLNGQSGNACSATCSIRTGGGGGPGNPGTPTGSVLTFPKTGQILFGPKGNVIVGDKKDPVIVNGDGKPYIYNDSEYDLSFDKLCIKKTYSDTNGSTQALSGDRICIDIANNMLYPYEKISIDNYKLNDFLSNKNGVPPNQSYGTATLTTSIIDDGIEHFDKYFATDLNVRVSKPSIATVGGGTSYVKDTSKIANVTDVAFTKKDENKNFVGTSVSTGNLSSYTAEVKDTVSVNTLSDAATVNKAVEKVTTTITSSATVTSLTSTELKNYNGLANVYILSGTNLVIDSIPSSLTGPRTYIVENANLVINGNLNYSDNIAFVVKGGNIQVDDSVTKLSGTYITIPNTSGIGGSIEGIGGNTDNVLTVKGSLYGELSNLVNTRTYVSNDTTSGQINVGTIVSFGSQIFKKPAPLVGQFISEYLKSEKVAR